MLTCIACSKQLGGAPIPDPDPDDDAAAAAAATPSTRQAIKALTSQIKDMALKASGAYRHCKPCAGSAAGRQQHPESAAASGSGRFHYSYRRAGESASSTPGIRGISSGEGTPSMSGRTEETASVAFMEEEETAVVSAAAAVEPKEWVAQVEPGVLITFLSLPQGGNDLKRIRFRIKTNWVQLIAVTATQFGLFWLIAVLSKWEEIWRGIKYKNDTKQ